MFIAIFIIYVYGSQKNIHSKFQLPRNIHNLSLYTPVHPLEILPVAELPL